MILDDYLFFITCIAFGAVAFFKLFVLLQIRSQASALYAGFWMVVRLGALGMLALLFWQIFQGVDFEEQQREDPFAEPHRIAYLQDVSRSMGLPATEKSKRQDFAEQTWLTLEAGVLGKQDVDIELRRYFFADQLAEPAERGRLSLGESSLEAALLQLVTLWNPEMVFLCSDGAANSLPVSDRTLRLYAQRGIRLIPVLPGESDSPLLDLRADGLSLPRHDPAYYKVSASAVPILGDQLLSAPEVQVLTRIEGRQVDLSTRTIKGVLNQSVEMPDVQPGWHEISIELMPVEHEVSRHNNRRRGAFHVSPRRKMVYLYDEENLEVREQIGLIRTLYPSEVDIVDLRDEKSIDALEIDILEAAWIADVSPDRVPKELKDRLNEMDIVFWGHDRLEDWLEEELDLFPLLGLEAHELEDSEDLWPWMKRGAHARLLPEQEGLLLHTRKLPKWSLVDEAWSELIFDYGEGSYPLFAVSQLEERWVGVCVMEDTWNWLRRRNEKERQLFTDFHESLLKRLIFPEPLPALAFDLQVVNADPLTVALEGKAIGEVPVSQMNDLRFDVRRGEEVTSVLAQLTKDGFGATATLEEDEVVFISAHGTADGRLFFSEARPFWREKIDPEINDTRLRLDRLKDLGEEEVLDADTFPPALEATLSSFQPVKRTLEVKRRQSAREIVMAIILVALLLLDWKLEKWIRERKTGQGYG